MIFWIQCTSMLGEQRSSVAGWLTSWWLKRRRNRKSHERLRPLRATLGLCLLQRYGQLHFLAVTNDGDVYLVTFLQAAHDAHVTLNVLHGLARDVDDPVGLLQASFFRGPAGANFVDKHAAVGGVVVSGHDAKTRTT